MNCSGFKSFLLPAKHFSVWTTKNGWRWTSEGSASPQSPSWPPWRAGSEIPTCQNFAPAPKHLGSVWSSKLSSAGNVGSSLRPFLRPEVWSEFSECSPFRGTWRRPRRCWRRRLAHFAPASCCGGTASRSRDRRDRFWIALLRQSRALWRWVRELPSSV